MNCIIKIKTFLLIYNYNTFIYYFSLLFLYILNYSCLRVFGFLGFWGICVELTDDAICSDVFDFLFEN